MKPIYYLFCLCFLFGFTVYATATVKSLPVEFVTQVHKVEQRYIELGIQDSMPQAIKTACTKMNANEDLTPREMLHALKELAIYDME